MDHEFLGDIMSSKQTIRYKYVYSYKKRSVKSLIEYKNHYIFTMEIYLVV